MKRIMLGLVIGALIFAGAVGAKVVSVTNPMTQDLDAARWNISGVDALYANHVSVADDLFFSDTDIVIGVHPGDPRVTGYNRAIGSLFISKPGGEWYRKTGPSDFDWTLLP